jgi:hypothetical protein
MKSLVLISSTFHQKHSGFPYLGYSNAVWGLEPVSFKNRLIGELIFSYTGILKGTMNVESVPQQVSFFSWGIIS